MSDINTAYRWAIEKCNAANVGYSLTYRDQQTVNGITYYDCSSFIWYALIAGGFDCVTANGGSAWPFVTSTMGAVLQALGFVSIPLTTPCVAGDILVHNHGSAGGHTEMVFAGGTETARTMGAHSASRPLADQVSINSGYVSFSAAGWEELYRYGGGVAYDWNNKQTGGYLKTDPEAQENVMKIVSVLAPHGWTINAIAGMVGNIEAESGLNPWRWEGDTVNLSNGYGLFQYTPATNYINDAGAQALTGFAPNYPQGSGGADDGTAQLLFMLLNSVQGGAQYIPTAAYPETFTQFQTSTKSPEYLASAWLKNFERAGVEVEAARRANAAYWYDFIAANPYYSNTHIWMYKKHFQRMRKKRR